MKWSVASLDPRAPRRAFPARAAALLFALAVLPLPGATSAQDDVPTSPVFSGQVVDAVTGSGIPGVSVVPPGSGRGQETNAQGFFVLQPGPGETRLRVRVERIGYRPVEVTLAAGGPPLRIVLHPVAIPIEGVEVRSIVAAEGRTPGAFTNLDRETIERDHWGQDLPVLLGGNVPGAYAYSDAGNGIGYSYLKIRGFGQRRIGVTINGIPLNDPQSREVYWIDHPDLAASAQSIQVQRGVGSAVYGTTSLGGSVAVETIPYRTDRELVLEAGGGSFDTQRFSLQAASGLLEGRWSLTSRLSRIRSDGYREQSWSDLWSYFAGLARVGDTQVLRLNLYGGPERTHLSYVGVPRAYLDGAISGDADRDRRFNPMTYVGERDQFFEPHYELLHDWKLSPVTSLSNALFYFQGTGFYDEFRTGRDLREYGHPDSIVTDIVRRRNAKNLHVGWVPRLRFTPGGPLSYEAGLELRLHEGKRWGELLWAAQQPAAPAPNHTYYEYLGRVTNTSGFARAAWQATTRLRVSGDLSLHRQAYELTDDAFNGQSFEETYTFLMPRVGATWTVIDAEAELLGSFNAEEAVFQGEKEARRLELYASYSRAQAEPIFRELYDPENVGVPPGFRSFDPATGRLSDPLLEPETVDDFALGLRARGAWGSASLGAYWMRFADEIVFNGRIDDNGNPITGNAARSRHAGVEGAFETRPRRWLELSGNFHVADDRFDEYVESLGADYSGNRIAGFPGWAARGRALARAGRGTLELGVEHVGRQYLDNTENERRNPALRDDPSWVDRTIEPWTAVHAALGLSLPRAWGSRALALSLRVDNLFDERYETSGYLDYPAPAFAPTPVWIPAATRRWFAGVKATF
jgi:iron complex outermembrane receptor protein